ncbi:MAG: DUF4150 domain-containing protein [Deltaproteobacteria bacterium]|nr:DUF4150 domain-containing protein [Deltaproteobacteria bacterium]
MFCVTLQGGMCFAFPDVCNTPSPAGPIPIPYPNICQGATADSSTVAQKVYIDGMQACTIKTKTPMSNGDEAGVSGGIVSGKNMDEGQFTQGSTKVYVEGSPAVRLTSPTKQNGSSSNAVGAAIAPSQVKVMILS